MRKYLVFGGSTFYPSGGFHDFIGEKSSLESALTLALENQRDWYQIVKIDASGFTIIKEIKSNG